MSTAIRTSTLAKDYKIFRKEPGLVGSLRSLVKRQYETTSAVKSLNLQITEGDY